MATYHYLTKYVVFYTSYLSLSHSFGTMSYFAIYHSFGTQVSQIPVWYVTRVSKFYKKWHLELDFHKLEFLIHKVQQT